VHVFEDKQDGSVLSRSLQDSANRIRYVEPNKFVVRDGRAVESKPLTQLGQDEAEVPRLRRKKGLYVGRPVLDECAESHRPWPVRRRPFAITRPTPEHTRASCVRSGREHLSKRRLADSWLTGHQHDLSASAERVIKRTAQL
jgi:hypothetical protein